LVHRPTYVDRVRRRVIVVGRRHAELGIRTEALEASELLGVAAHREIAHLLVEPLRPVIFRGLIAETGAEVMNDVAAADEKDALVAKRRQSLAERAMGLRRRGPVDAELYDRNVRLGKHPHEDGPRAGIETPVAVE